MRTIILSLILFLSFNLSAQNKDYFAPAKDGFSKKKEAYFTLMDGSEITAKIKKLKRKKALFEKIIITGEDGKKKELKAEDIKSMYLPQSGFDKFAKLNSQVYDMTEWDRSDLNQEYLQDGYAYFESTEVFYKKKKKRVLLLQLLNPAFPNQVKVFHDPLAKESAGLGIGGLKVAGGGDKSYFIKIGSETAFKLKKKNYEDKAKEIYSACPNFLRKIDKFKWSEFGESLFKYSETCK